MPDHVARHFFVLSSYEESTERNYDSSPMRGANRVNENIIISNIDSSPHARGQFFTVKFTFSLLRFIPPCEGPTCFACLIFIHLMIHPPMRGAYFQYLHGFEHSAYCRYTICTILQCICFIHHLLDEKNDPTRLTSSQSHPIPPHHYLPRHPRLQYPR